MSDTFFIRASHPLAREAAPEVFDLVKRGATVVAIMGSTYADGVQYVYYVYEVDPQNYSRHETIRDVATNDPEGWLAAVLR
jgi:hypothetical protein